MKSLGDFDASAVIYGKFTTFRPSTGAAYTLGGTPALSVYKDNSTTQSASGVTLTADFDSVTGLNHFAIDTSADGTFYSAGSFFDVVITTGTVDSVSVVGAVVASFTIRKTSALKPTTAGRTLDVSSGGEAGIDWANVGSPTTTLNLSGTTVKTATDVETDTADIQSRLPAALVGGRMDANVGAISADATAADSLEAILDGTGAALTLKGADASGSTPATAGLTVTGGAASTTSGGTAAAAILATGGAGAASTNGSAGGARFVAGGTTTVSGAEGLYALGTGAGAGLRAIGGSTGNGGHFSGGASGGNGLRIFGAAANALHCEVDNNDIHGAYFQGQAAGHGICVVGGNGDGSGTGDGINATSSGTGAGVRVESFVVTAAISAATNSLPWNASWDAEVQSEAEDALAAYDPPTRAELTSDTNSVLARLRWLVIADGTVGSTGNSTTAVHLPGLTYGNDEIVGYMLVLYDASAGERHWRKITDWVLATELATVDALPFTPQDATDTYALLATLADASVTGGDATAANQATIIALLGTPAGASVSADILAVDNLVDDLEGRLTSTRAGYLDNLSGGAVALEATAQSILTDTGTTLQGELDDIQSRLPAALVSGRMDASVGAYQSGLAPLQPTTAGRTLDVTATGAAGIDWANVENPTATVALSGTTVATATSVTNGVNVTQWRGSTPGNLDSNSYLPANVAAINGNLTRASNLASACDNYSATRGLSGTALPAAAADAAGGLPVSDAGGLDLDAILADTADMQPKLGTPAASVSADIAAVKSDTGNLVTRIPAALFSGITSLAQWLGLIAGKQAGDSTARTELRATGAGSGTFDEAADSLEAQRDNVGTAGAGLTAADDATLSAIAALNNLSSAQAQTAAAAALAAYDPPTNAEMEARTIAAASYSTVTTAQVNAEVDAALADIHLDHLLAADYDPASKPGVATALLNELIVSDAGVSQFSTNALENAPAGGGGGGSTAEDIWEYDISAESDTSLAGGALRAAYAALAASGLSVTVGASPVPADGGVVRLVVGDDYTSAGGNPLSWSVTTSLTLTAASLYLYTGTQEASGVRSGYPLACTLTAVSGGYTITRDLTAAQTGALTAGTKMRYELIGTHGASLTRTLAAGVVEATR